MKAFRHALEHGARGLETDAWLSSDGQVVLVHDPWVWGRRFGVIPWRLRIEQTSAARLARHDIPRLADLYGELGASYELSIDLKSPDVGPAIIDLARAHGDPARLWLCSPSTRRLRRLREDAADVRLVHSQFRSRLPEPLERHAANLAEAQIDVMNMHHSEWTAGLVALFHRFSVLTFAWDVQEVRHLRNMIRLGIDAVYCDHVERMVATVAEFS
jgi:glycerophosphoryl diester phosphodiesterase